MLLLSPSPIPGLRNRVPLLEAFVAAPASWPLDSTPSTQSLAQPEEVSPTTLPWLCVSVTTTTAGVLLAALSPSPPLSSPAQGCLLGFLCQYLTKTVPPSHHQILPQACSCNLYTMSTEQGPSPRGSFRNVWKKLLVVRPGEGRAVGI